MPARRAAPTLLALIALSAALAVACAPVAPTPVPVVTPAPTGAPSGGVLPTDVPPTDTQPAPTYGPDNISLVTNIAGVVVVDSLPIYDAASVTAPSVGAFVRDDVVLLLLVEPIVVDGTTWQYAKKLETPAPGVLPDLPATLPDAELVLLGWIVVTDVSGATVRPLEPRCPDNRDFDYVSAMLPGERLACFGTDPITLDGQYTCGPCDDTVIGDQQPVWLANNPRGLLRSLDGSAPSLGQFFGLYFPPSVEAPTENMPMRVTGHFDDAVSSTCTLIDDRVRTPDAIAVHVCRSRFVVDSYELLSVEYIPPEG